MKRFAIYKGALLVGLTWADTRRQAVANAVRFTGILGCTAREEQP